MIYVSLLWIFYFPKYSTRYIILNSFYFIYNLMGSVSSNPNSDETGTISNLPMHLRKMELKFDITKEVNPDLKQLLHCNNLIYYE